MIKVGFWFDRPQEYAGGLNYLRNLLFALSIVEEKKIDPYIFFGKNVSDEVAESFRPLATVIRTSALDRKSAIWFLHKLFFKFFKSLLIIELIAQKHGLSIISHPQSLYGKSKRIKIIGWIPDFQYLHLPEFFPNLNVDHESKRMRMIANQSDALILSSYSALQDYMSITQSQDEANIKVLQFVSQPQKRLIPNDYQGRIDALELKYNFKGKFFFLPNQFWRHKNHGVVFSAIQILKELKIEASLICTGNLKDYRIKNEQYINDLLDYLKINKLEDNIKILGDIEYSEVLTLMNHCIAVVNPSLFEGWSSTVEEAKSMGKRIILSDIPTHREQNPPCGYYFNPGDSASLAKIIKQCMGSNFLNVQNDSVEILKIRTLKYANEYTKIVMDLSN